MYCIDENSLCPLTSLQIGQPKIYQSNGLMIGRNETSTPVIRFIIRQGALSMELDENHNLVDEIEFTQYAKSNGLNTYLPSGIDITNVTKESRPLNLISVSYRRWNYICHDHFTELIDYQVSAMESLERHNLIILIITCSLAGVFVFESIIIYMLPLINQKSPKVNAKGTFYHGLEKISNAMNAGQVYLHLSLRITLLVFAAISTTKADLLHNFFSTLYTKGCSDHQVNRLFSNIEDMCDRLCRTYLSLCLLISCFIAYDTVTIALKGYKRMQTKSSPVKVLPASPLPNLANFDSARELNPQVQINGFDDEEDRGLKFITPQTKSPTGSPKKAEPLSIPGSDTNSNPDPQNCLLYTSDAADDLLCVDLGGRRIIQKKQ
eukprot:TRINITY_DN11251_c0_g1_i2.p1 TRINITY_DN11251_c0_g1~~TRINITY_DN11251_c0_g1_i2.p1  ORF type:complete len:378 (-),score=67.19 TRINITY_DN11251_c0_g1_i2:5-1138(-)